MARVRLKELLQALTDEEKKEIILTGFRWRRQEELVGIRTGIYPVPVGGVEVVLTRDPRFEDRLSEAVMKNDCDGVLKIGVSDLFRGLNIMQRESTGPQLNVFLKRHLSDRIFRLLYEAAGLDVSELKYDPDFPTDFPLDISKPD